MDDLYELKELLCRELEEYGRRGTLKSGSLDVVDKLAHTIKNIDKIIENMDGQYSNRDGMPYDSYGRGRYEGTYEGSYNDGSYRGGSYDDGSYARGRRNVRRDSMGRYSGDGYSRAAEDMMESLREIEHQAPNEKIRQEINRLSKKVEQMM